MAHRWRPALAAWVAVVLLAGIAVATTTSGDGSGELRADRAGSTTTAAAPIESAAAPATPPPTPPPTTAPPPPPRVLYSVQLRSAPEPEVRSMGLGGDERVEPGPAVHVDQRSPDGRSIVLDRTSSSTFDGCGIAGCSSTRTSSGSIAVAGADGGGERVIAEGGFDRGPRWSPTGDLIAYVSHVTGPDGEQDVIRLVRPTGEDVAILGHPGTNNWPAFSPDGRFLAFVNLSRNPEGTGNLYAVHVVDLVTAEDRVVSTADLAQLAWSPDGTRIAGAAASGGDALGGAGHHDQLAVVDLASGELRVLFTAQPSRPSQPLYVCGASVNDFPFVQGPAWSPDGSLLAFAHNEAHLHEEAHLFDIAIVAPDGSGLRALRTAPPVRCDPLYGRDYETVTILGWASG